MNEKEKRNLINAIEAFEVNKHSYSPRDAEYAFINILQPLLSTEGYNFNHTGGVNDRGIDFLATRNAEKLGIEFKHLKGKVGADQVRALIGASVVNKLDKAILISSSNFSNEAKQIAQEVDPISIELLDLNDLKKWTAKIEASYDESDVTKVLRDCTKRIIELIKVNPRTLDQIEWRDLERVVAELFDGIGFKVTLTPPSKDGGKDVILECVSEGTHQTYIVEIKHWRSRQKVASNSVKDFVKVITKEKRKAGLFLSTYGYAENVVESHTEIEKQKVIFGQEEKIVSLCNTYLKRKSGLWQKEQNLADIIIE